MNQADRRAMKQDKKLAAQRRAAEKKRREQIIEEYNQRHGKKRGAGSIAYDFAKTFLIFIVLFTAILTPTVYVKDSVADTALFGEENVAVEDEIPVFVDTTSPFFDAFTNSKKINILLMGVNPPLTDTIMLVCLDEKQGRVDVISVPRDTFYEREGYNSTAEKKINAAFRGDPINTAKAVNEILMGIPINYYAVIEYDDVEKIVDAVGGVPMNLTRDYNYEDPYDTPPLKIHLKAGQQVLNGSDSVKFLRYRHDYKMGDIERIQAQQVWVKSAIKQTLSMGLGMVDVAKLACKEIDSDVTVGAAVKIATAAVGMSADNIYTYTMPHTLGEDFVFPKTEEIATMLMQIYDIPDPNATTGAAVTSDGAVETSDGAVQ